MFTQPRADQLVQAATAAMASGRAAQAAALLADALAADPRHPMALTRLSELAITRKDAERALALTDAALAIEPNFAPALHQRASALWSSGRQAEAVQAAEKAVAIQPPNPEFRLRLAQFAAWTGQGGKTLSAIAPILATPRPDDPHYAAAVAMQGELAIAEGRFQEANAHFDRALDMQPGLAVIRMQRGMNRLRLGQFQQGWPDYAAREAIPGLFPDGWPDVAEQPWQGQSLAGKTLVVLDDQGHGDAIQFFRYMPLLHGLGPVHVIWRTFPPLVRLLAEAAPYATVTAALPGNKRYDFQCNSTGLPRWFDAVPAEVPYLRPPPRVKIKRPARRHPNVGLVWSGDARHTRDHLRSIPAGAFLRLADTPGIEFHSLQHVVRQADLPALTVRPAIGREVGKAADLADTAALIARLDLVITVDTAIAHLAGAMGKPVWIILHVAPDWRWMADRTDSPWYPTARLFRVAPAEWLGQPAGTDWLPVLDRVAAALRGYAAGAQPGIIRPKGRPANR